jgi:hypothetical protein
LVQQDYDVEELLDERVVDDVNLGELVGVGGGRLGEGGMEGRR